jgi:hypothetical protein
MNTLNSITLGCISNQNKSANSCIPSKKTKREFWKMGQVQYGISKLRTKNMNGNTYKLKTT